MSNKSDRVKASHIDANNEVTQQNSESRLCYYGLDMTRDQSLLTVTLFIIYSSMMLK